MRIDSQTAIAILPACIFLMLFAIEKCFPLREPKFRFASRLITNIALSALGFIAGMAIVRIAVFKTINISSDNTFGLLYALPLNHYLRSVIGFMLMDATFYYWHWANHRIDFLWRFHSVHHIDLDMDVTTSFRFHFGEVLLSTPFRVLQALLLGITPITFVAYETCFQAAVMFHHSNIRLPIKLERLLNLIFVTPRMHGIHHSTVRSEVNSNYSTIFRFWDALHKTMILNVPQSKVVIGVTGYLDSNDNTISALLTLPFRKQKLSIMPSANTKAQPTQPKSPRRIGKNILSE